MLVEPKKKQEKIYLPGAGIAAAAILMCWSDGMPVRCQMVAIRRPGVYPRLLFSKS